MAKILNILLSIAIVHATSMSAVAAPETSDIYLAPPEIRAKTFSYSKGLLEISDTLDSKYHDVDARAESLDYDLTQVVDFVVRDIAYRPYLGLMRGPSGTLSTESGSSWDQAVLMAALINAAGGEAMLGVGVLSRADTERLLATVLDTHTPVSGPLDAIDWDDTFRRTIGIEPLDIGDAQDTIALDDYTKAAQHISANLQVALKSKDIVIGQSDQAVTDTYLDAIASEYVWVRYRDTPNDPWIDVHPVFGGKTVPSVEALEYIASSVPQDRMHRIGVQFAIEVQQGDTVQRKNISAEYIRPAANLSASQLRLGIAPNRPFGEGASTFFLPSIEGQVPDGGMAFDLMGNITSPEDAASGPEIFRTVGSRVGSAIDALADGDESLSAPRLTGVLMTITQIAPGGARIEDVRRLTDFREGQPKMPVAEVAFDGVLEVDVGAENGVRNMKALLESSAVYVRQLPYKLAYIAKEMTGTEYMGHPAFENEASHNWYLALSSDSFFSHANMDGFSVRTAPLVMVKRNMMSATGGLAVVVDIQHNETLSLTRGNTGSISVSAQNNLTYGIRDTLLEGELIGVSSMPEWTQQPGGDLITSDDDLKGSQIWTLSSLNQQDRLQNDLARSGALFVPTDSDRNWWRVNPETGVILGMSMLGGSETTEEVTLYEFISTMFSGYVFANGVIGGTKACASAGSGNFEACCLAGMGLLNVGAGIGGMKLGGALGTALGVEKMGAALGALYSITFDVATGIMPPVGDAINATAIGVCGAVFEK